MPDAELDKQEKRNKKKVEKCYDMLANTLQNGTYTQFLKSSLYAIGCNYDNPKLYKCDICPEEGTRNLKICIDASASGTYNLDGTGRITICANGVYTKRHMDRVVAHELIHAYDECRAKVDWNNCEHIACSEIRAANLNGDCKATSELKRGLFKQKGGQIDCVRRRAIKAVSLVDKCKDTATECVDRAFARCFIDIEPFIDIP